MMDLPRKGDSEVGSCDVVRAGIITAFVEEGFYGFVQPFDATFTRFFHHNDLIISPEIKWAEVAVGSRVEFRYGEGNKIHDVKPLGKDFFDKPKGSPVSSLQKIKLQIIACICAKGSIQSAVSKDLLLEFCEKKLAAKAVFQKELLLATSGEDSWRIDRMKCAVLETDRALVAVKDTKAKNSIVKFYEQYLISRQTMVGRSFTNHKVTMMTDTVLQNEFRQLSLPKPGHIVTDIFEPFLQEQSGASSLKSLPPQMVFPKREFDAVEEAIFYYIAGWLLFVLRRDCRDDNRLVVVKKMIGEESRRRQCWSEEEKTLVTPSEGWTLFLLETEGVLDILLRFDCFFQTDIHEEVKQYLLMNQSVQNAFRLVCDHTPLSGESKREERSLFLKSILDTYFRSRMKSFACNKARRVKIKASLRGSLLNVAGNKPKKVFKFSIKDLLDICAAESDKALLALCGLNAAKSGLVLEVLQSSSLTDIKALHQKIFVTAKVPSSKKRIIASFKENLTVTAQNRLPYILSGLSDV